MGEQTGESANELRPQQVSHRANHGICLEEEAEQLDECEKMRLRVRSQEVQLR